MKTKRVLLALALHIVACHSGLAGSRPNFDAHAEEQTFRALRWIDENGQIPRNGFWRALEHRRQSMSDAHKQQKAPLALTGLPPDEETVKRFRPPPPSPGLGTNSWTQLGPGNIGGRMRSILIHPTATNVLWCGGVNGGVWKSTNSGASWFPLDDFMANLAVACLAMDPLNADVIYAGTGEGTNPYFHAHRGAGIFKTTDGGNTWMQLPSTTDAPFQYVNRLAIDPNNSQVILAATRNGIFRSENGGSDWTNRYAPEVLYAAFFPCVKHVRQ